MLADAEFREDFGFEEAESEFCETKARMRDVDALEQVGVRVERVETGVASDGREVFVLLEQRGHGSIIHAIRVRKAENGRQAVPFEQEF